MHCDLHMHSTVSDGTMTVRELVRAVGAAGVAAFSLTDHDSVNGLDQARDEATRLGLRMLNGIEISTRLDGAELHILGYGFDAADGPLNQALAAMQAVRRERIPIIIAKLNEQGVAVRLEHVLAIAKDANPGRPHVARALVAQGLCTSLDQAFERYLGDHCLDQIPKPVPSPREAIGWLHAAGGRAVWAHPLVRPIRRPFGVDGLARELRGFGLDGIEVVHPSQSPGDRRRLRKLCGQLGLIATGGSDFHGTASPEGGAGLGSGAVPIEVFEVLSVPRSRPVALV